MPPSPINIKGDVNAQIILSVKDILRRKGQNEVKEAENKLFCIN